MASVVALVGSRSGVPARLVRRVARALLSSGRSLAVGCCVGVDAVAVSAAFSSRWASALSVFAAFGPGGAGSVPPVSAVRPVVAAASLGCSVRWWAGGRPPVPARARLSARSRAVVSAALAGGPGSGLVALVSSPPRPGSGSWGAVSFAASRGLPVVVFPVGFPASALPLLGAGSWLPAASSGLFAAAFRWLPAEQLSFSFMSSVTQEQIQ